MPQNSPNDPAEAATPAESRPTAHILADLAELTIHRRRPGLQIRTRPTT